MAWKFERVAGPFKGATGGLAWDGASLYFSAVDEDRVLRLHPERNAVEEYRRWTYRANGLAVGPGGELYACQEGGRRVVQYLPEGITTPTALQLEGRYHNFPCDLAVDSGGRVWFSDPYNPVPAFGPQLYPLLEHQSVLRMRRERSGWSLQRMTFDTVAPRAIALSPDEKTLYVADGDPKSRLRELRAYPILPEGLGPAIVLHTFGADYRGPHRGIEGLCVDSEGDLLACAGWNKSGPGPLIYVFSPAGTVLETHALPCDLPMRIAFGDSDHASLYLTTAEGCLYRARGIGRRGSARKPAA